MQRAIRTLVSAPLRLASFTIVLTLASTIAAMATVSAFASGVFVRSFSAPLADKVIDVSLIPRQLAGTALYGQLVPYDVYRAWRRETQNLGDVAAFNVGFAFADVMGSTHQFVTIATSSDAFRLLGASPKVGRAFGASDDIAGSVPVVVLSDAFWKRYLGGNDVIGRFISLNGHDYEIIGVMQPSFHIPTSVPESRRDEPEMWTSFGSLLSDQANPYVNVFLQPRSGRQSTAVLSSRLNSILSALQPKAPIAGQQLVVKLDKLRDVAIAQVRRPMAFLVAAVACLLIISCANVGSLISSMLVIRRRERAVRIALGADTHHLVLQLASECAVLLAASTMLGLLGARLIVPVVFSIVGQQLPDVGPYVVDSGVALITVAAAALFLSVMMIGPVAVELRRPPGESLRSTTSNATVGRKARRTLEAFVVGEVALATMLLMGAVLLLTSLYRLEHRDRGYTAQGVMTASVFLKGDNLGTPARQAAVAQAMIAALKNTPGIRDAAVASAAPLLTSSSSEVSRSSSGTGQSMQVWSVSDDYFQTLHVPLRFGHLFGSAEASVVVIDSGAAIRLFGTTAALGQRLYIGTARIPATIVGLVGSIDDLRNGIRTGAVIRSIGPHIYTPFRERPGRRLTLLVRSSLGEADASNTIRLIIGSVAPGTPILSVQSMTSIEQQEFARERFTSFLAAGSAILGLVIALVGLYALMNAVVAQHSRSYVLRLVLGAPRWTVLRAATQRVMVLGGLGVTVGLCLGGFNARVLASVLFETRAGDPRLYAFVVAAVMLTLTAAALWPTRRLLKQELTAVLR